MMKEISNSVFAYIRMYTLWFVILQQLNRLSSQWTVQVDPKFHEDASNLEELVPFEECIELHSSDKAVVKAPEYLYLTHNGRSFK